MAFLLGTATLLRDLAPAGVSSQGVGVPVLVVWLSSRLNLGRKAMVFLPVTLGLHLGYTFQSPSVTANLLLPFELDQRLHKLHRWRGEGPIFLHARTGIYLNSTGAKF